MVGRTTCDVCFTRPKKEESLDRTHRVREGSWGEGERETERERERERERGQRPVLRLVREEAEATTKPSQPRPQKIEINCFVNMYTFQ